MPALKTDTTYIICPEKTCQLFWDTGTPFPCDGHCPFQERQKLMVLCPNCHARIMLSGGSSRWQRINHQCPDGRVSANFCRMNGKYHLLYEVPPP